MKICRRCKVFQTMLPTLKQRIYRP
jgi:hypothetical protein